ncbi:2Fe-2S iron-sulfur cluster binding domain-containing protein [Bacillus sp. FJAT-29953]|nr:2Fe-2S iron-sulfur cluster binding domain-containing protein [Bacillus sp. FJAT-29953]
MKFTISSVKGKFLDAALHQGQSINFNCRKGTCGQCTVKVVDSSTGLTKSMQNSKRKSKMAIAWLGRQKFFK